MTDETDDRESKMAEKLAEEDWMRTSGSSINKLPWNELPEERRWEATERFKAAARRIVALEEELERSQIREEWERSFGSEL